MFLFLCSTSSSLENEVKGTAKESFSGHTNLSFPMGHSGLKGLIVAVVVVIIANTCSE